MAYFSEADAADFVQAHCSNPKAIADANIGSYVNYKDPVKRTTRQAIFWNKNTEGKFQLHFPGSHYSEDATLMEKEFVKYCSFDLQN